MAGLSNWRFYRPNQALIIFTKDNLYSAVNNPRAFVRSILRRVGAPVVALLTARANGDAVSLPFKSPVTVL